MKKQIINNWWKQKFFDFDMIKILFNKKKIEDARREVDWIVQKTNIVPHADILDVGCGIGRHSIEFAKRSFRVVGIDVSRKFLEEAKQLAKRKNANVKFYKLPMHKLRFRNKFDLVINLYSSFGYYTPRLVNSMVFKKMSMAIKQNGYLILDTIYSEAIERQFQPKSWRFLDEGGVVLEERRYMKSKRELHNHWIYIRGKQMKHYHFKLHLYSLKELEKMFNVNGLKIVGRYGSLKDDNFGNESFHVVLIGKNIQSIA